MGDVISPYGYNFDSRAEKLFRIDGERDIRSNENAQFGVLLDCVIATSWAARVWLRRFSAGFLSRVWPPLQSAPHRLH